MKTETQIALQYEQLRPTFNERTRREWAASEALSLGRGGIAKVHRATGMVPSTIGKGIRELRERAAGAETMDPTRVRKAGGGRRTKVEKDISLLGDLQHLVEPVARGDPESPLRWISKSLRKLALDLVAMGHEISFRTVGSLLKQLGYSLQANSKTVEGNQHVDRNAQFGYINEKMTQQLLAGNPGVSVDTKKKELVGNFKNAGRELCPTGKPTKVDVHDFIGELGRASPYGVYDIGGNVGWVSVGISADTSEFAVESLRRWWKNMGAPRYPAATSLLVTADCGGSNGYRVRLWKLELQKLANELRMPITVCHLPPGTSKWNKIEHKMFSFISMNWRGRPLVDYQTIVSLIAATKTEKGLVIQSELNDNVYQKGRKVTDDEMAGLNITPHEFHGEWNYTIGPQL